MANYNIDAIYNGNTSLPGTERVRIDSSGNIGIGTATPSTKLHIYENANRVTYISQNDNHIARFEAYGTATAIDTTASNGIFFRISSGDIVKFAADGNVGIGTSTAGAPLHIYRASNPWIRLNGGGSFGYIRLDDGTSNGYLFKNTSSDTSNGALAGAMYTYTDSNKAFQHIHNGTPLFTILSSGYVGISTSSPTAQLHICLDTSTFPTKNVVRIVNLGYSGITGAQNWTIRGAYQYSGGIAVNADGGDLDLIKSLDRNTILATKTDGTALGNVGIGTTSPGAKFEVKGIDDAAITAIFQSTAGGNAAYNGGIQLGNAASSQNSQIYHNSSGDNTLTFVSNYGSGTGNKFIFAPGGTERVRFQQNGNVGIGTTSPSTTFHVYGNAEVGDSTADTGLIVRHGSGSSQYGRIRFYSASTNINTIHSFPTAWNSGTLINSSAGAINLTGTNGITFGAWNSVDVAFASGGTNYFKGNVGIGISTPSAILNIRASAPTSTGTVTTGTNLLIDSNTSNYITFRNTADNGTYAGLTFLDNNTGGYIVFRNYTGDVAGGSDSMIYGTYQDHIFQNGSSETINGKTETMRIKGNGNVGIGTNNPTAKLHIVQGNSGGVAAILLSTDESTIQGPSANTQIRMGSNLVLSASNVIPINTNGSERVRITSDGNVGIGTTSPITKLQVRDGAITAGTTTSTSGTTMLVGQYNDGNLTVFGTEYSSGGPMLGYGVTPSTTSAAAFLSSTGVNVYRSAYVQDGGTHRWYTGAVQTVAIGNAVSISEKMRINIDGNLGIGTSSPANKLHIFTGTVQVSGLQSIAGGPLTFLRSDYNGSAAVQINFLNINPSNGFDSDLGIQLMNTGGSMVDVLRIKGSTGNVGIGTTSPSVKLTVSGDVTDSDVGQFRAVGSTSAAKMINVGYHTTNNYGFISALIAGTGYSALSLQPNGGNVGIGTTSPGCKLVIVGETQISSSSAYTTHLNYNDAGTNFITTANTGYTYFRGSSNNVTTMTVTGGGNVGIGTTTVRANLHLNGDFIRDSNIPYSWGTSAPFRTFSGAYSYANGGVNGPNRYLLLWPQITSTNGQNGRFVNAKLIVSRGATHAYNDTTIGEIVASAGYNSSANLYSYTPLIGEKLYFYNVVYNSVTYLAISLPISDFRWELSGHFGIEETAYYSPTFVYSNTSGVGTITQLTTYTNESLAIYNNGGNIGINTTTPTYKLDVNGSINTNSFMYISYQYGDAYPLQLVGSNFLKANSNYYGLLIRSGDTNFISGRLNLIGGSSKRFEIHGYEETVGYIPTVIPGGNVGIGTTNPEVALHVQRASGDSTATFKAASGGAEINLDATNGYAALKIYSSGTEKWRVGQVADSTGFQIYQGGTGARLYINSSGNIGVGTTGPTQRLHVLTTGGSATAPNIVATFQANTATTILAGGGTAIKFVGVSSGGNLQDYDQGMISTLGYADNNRHGMQFWVKPNASTVLTVGQTIDSNGNVGIGTTSPATKLEVYGVVRVSESSSGGILQLTAGASAIDIASTFYGGSRRPITFTMDGEKVRIAADGNVGIGTSSPVNKLHIVNSGNYQVATIQGDSNYTGVGGGQLRIRGNTNVNKTIEVGYNTSTDVGFIQAYVNTGSAQTICLNPDGGNVGIGITSPITKLHVAGTTSIIPTYDSGSGYSYFLRMGYDTSGFYDYTIKRNGSTGFLEFNGTQGSTYVSYVFAGGDVYSGVSGGTIGGFYFNSSSHGIRRATGTNDVYCFTTSGTLYLGAGGSSTTHVRVLSGGDVGIGVSPSYKLDVNGNIHGTGFPTSSDVRFKKNITPLQNSLEKIKKLQGVKYEWNEFVNSRRDGYKLNIPIIGLIAQDVEQVVPEIVDHWKLSEDCQDARSIDYPRLIPLLIEAMKEQQNQIEELRNEIKSLKSN